MRVAAYAAGDDEHCLCEVMARLDVSQSSMSRHMAALKQAELITDRRDAQWMRYRRRDLDDPALQTVVEAILSASDGAESAATSCDRNAA